MNNRFLQKPAKKPFSWSYSKLKSYESCPKRHLHADIIKDYVDEIGDNLKEGNEAHDALAKRVKEGVPLPEKFAEYEKWVERLTKGSNAPGVQVLTEQKLAMREDFTPCEFFDRQAWFRGIIDIAKMSQKVALVADYKMGKVLEDSVQLALFAQLMFSHYPELIAIRTEFIWLKHDCTTREDFKREDMQMLWAALMPRIEPLKQAYLTDDYPAVRNGLCRNYCPVPNSVCGNSGKEG